MFDPDYSEAYEAFKGLEDFVSIGDMEELAEPEYTGKLAGQRIRKRTKQRQERQSRKRGTRGKG